ncbi:MAG: hypothetical protein M1829_001667 [Trizodia sp. TS-e1964]|nr:MAG: hypothetical protein M1829_001667 [Trizodia sp. TS-e1964]
MPKTARKELSIAKRAAIVALSEISGNARQTQGNISRRLVVSKPEVFKTIKHVNDQLIPNATINEKLDTSVLPSKPCFGRSRAISDSDRDQMIESATRNKEQQQKSWPSIARECLIYASETAIRHAFELLGYGRYKPNYKPYLTPEMKQKRLKRCLARSHWKEEWKIVVWTDETVIRVGEHKGQKLGMGRIASAETGVGRNLRDLGITGASHPPM